MISWNFTHFTTYVVVLVGDQTHFTRYDISVPRLEFATSDYTVQYPELSVPVCLAYNNTPGHAQFDVEVSLFSRGKLSVCACVCASVCARACVGVHVCLYGDVRL